MLELPRLIGEALKSEDRIREIAIEIAKARDILYLGRGQHYPIALEGALKLKEISYIHAEGYAAGELKHGPIALIDENTPVIMAAPHDHLFEKSLSNLQEVAARHGRVLLISDAEGIKAAGKAPWATLEIPTAERIIQPIVADHPAAAASLSCGGRKRHGCRPAAQPRQIGHGRVRAAKPAYGWQGDCTPSLTISGIYHEACPQGRPSRRRLRHARAAGHQGGSEGNATRLRPPRPAIRRRRGARSRHRALRLRHRPGQAGHRGLFRQGLSSWKRRVRRKKKDEDPGRGPRRRAASGGPPASPASRQPLVSAMPSSVPAISWATNPSPSCFPT